LVVEERWRKGDGSYELLPDSAMALGTRERERTRGTERREKGAKERLRERDWRPFFVEQGGEVASMRMHGRATRRRAPTHGQPQHLPMLDPKSDQSCQFHPKTIAKTTFFSPL
jgi:hypothetical protein